MSLRLEPKVTLALRAEMIRVSDAAVDAIMAEVPAYTDAWQGSMGHTIAAAVRQALDGFVTIASRSSDEVVPRSAAVDGAYALLGWPNLPNWSSPTSMNSPPAALPGMPMSWPPVVECASATSITSCANCSAVPRQRYCAHRPNAPTGPRQPRSPR